MDTNRDIKKLERLAKSMLLDKEIPPDKLSELRKILKDQSISPEKRYKNIIALVKNYPDKSVEVNDVDSIEIPPPESKPVTKEKTAAKIKVSPPTDTSLYIETIKRKYAHLKIFKKRYLVHRDNRFGFSFRKRLIPTKTFLLIMKNISGFQEIVIEDLNQVISIILNDKEAENPVNFNYLRVIRSWLLDSPMSSTGIESIKWMERHNFEREFKSYIIHFFSFIKLNAEVRENLFIEVEKYLRLIDKYKKFDIFENDSDQTKRKKEKSNLNIEKQIYKYMMTFRSFLPSNIGIDYEISKYLKNNHNIDSLSNLIVIIVEALIYQREFSIDELISYYEISFPTVSKNKWDYNKDVLKKIGKDQESKSNRNLTDLRKKLIHYETFYQLLNIENENEDENLVLNGVEEQWRCFDKRRQNPIEIRENNFIQFIDSAVNYFKNGYLSFINDSIIYMSDGENEYESSLFEESCFSDEVAEFGALTDKLHLFRSNNPTLSISNSEMKKIMRKQLQSMNHVEKLLIDIGSCFYKLGRKLQKLYFIHLQWERNGSIEIDNVDVHSSCKNIKIEGEQFKQGVPFPFYDCTIKGFEESDTLKKGFNGEKIFSSIPDESIIVHMTTFSYQVASECNYIQIFRDLHVRKDILEKIDKTK